MPNPFICPCGETRAQQLLTSHLCANPECTSYDEDFAREATSLASKTEEELIVPVTSSNDTYYTLTTTSSCSSGDWTFYDWKDGDELLIGAGVKGYSDNQVGELEERISSLEETVEILQKAVLQLQQNAISKPEPKPEPKSEPSDSQLQMQMAMDSMYKSRKNTDLQFAEMQLEKIRHATHMQMTQMKHDLKKCACDDTGPCKTHGETNKDPLDQAMQDFLKRRLQNDMIKELNPDISDDLF